MYPHLGRFRAAWQRAGASPEVLQLVDAAHQAAFDNPLVLFRYRNRRIDPLGDAFAIFSSPVWRDPWLADRRLTIDPVFEASEIIHHTNRVDRMLREVAARKAQLRQGSVARQHYATYEQALLRSLDAARHRAVALNNYRQQVARLEIIQADQRALPEAEAMADRVLDLLSEAERQKLHAEQVQQSVTELASAEDHLRALTTILTGHAIETPSDPQT